MNSENIELSDFPKKNYQDRIYEVLQIVLGISGQMAGRAIEAPADLPLQALFTSSFDPPIIRRRDKWLKELAKKFEVMSSSMEQLNEMISSDSEKFISLLMQAIPIVVKNHQKEKLDALTNIMVNSFTSETVDDDIEFIVLNLVDNITPSHIQILRTFHWKWRDENNFFLHTTDGEIHNFDKTYPQFKGKYKFFYTIIRDLINLNLLNRNNKFPTLGSGPLWRRDQEGISYQAPPELLLQEGQMRRLEVDEKLAGKGIVDISIYELSELGQTFIEFITEPEL